MGKSWKDVNWPPLVADLPAGLILTARASAHRPEKFSLECGPSFNFNICN